MRSGGCSNLLKTLESPAGVTAEEVSVWFLKENDVQFRPSCGDSCATSPKLHHQTMDPRRWTRSDLLCGGPDLCGSAGRLGSATPWEGSSAGKGCRSWSRPACSPSEGFPFHIVAATHGKVYNPRINLKSIQVSLSWPKLSMSKINNSHLENVRLGFGSPKSIFFEQSIIIQSHNDSSLV